MESWNLTEEFSEDFDYKEHSVPSNSPDACMSENEWGKELVK